VLVSALELLFAIDSYAGTKYRAKEAVTKRKNHIVIPAQGLVAKIEIASSSAGGGLLTMTQPRFSRHL
jgi:hypothetical protein